MERVVVARLRDAAFFFAEDMKRPLADRVKDLAGVTFHRASAPTRTRRERLVAPRRHAWARSSASSTKGEREAAREAAPPGQGRPDDADGPRVPGAAGRDGRDLPARPGRSRRRTWREAVRWHYHPVSIEEGSAPAGALRRRRRHRVRARSRWRTSWTRWPATSASASCRRAAAIPTACAAPRRAPCASSWTSGTPTATEKRPSLRASSPHAAVAGYEGTAEAAGGRRRARPRGLPARPPPLRASSPRGFAAGRGGGRPGRARAGRPRRSARGLAAPAGAAPRPRWRPRRTSSPGRRLQAGQEHPGRPGAARPWTRRCSRRRRSASCTRRSRRLRGRGRRLRGAAALARGLRGPVDRFFDDVLVMAEDPQVRANRLGLLVAGPLALLSHRGHLETWRLSFGSIRLLLRRRQGGRQQGHEGHPRRQGRRPGGDDQRRPARAARASPSPPPPATSTRSASGSLPAGDRRRRSRRPSASSRRSWARSSGDAADPLLVSVRSGAKFSMPGMMDTILNLGLNDRSVEGLKTQDRQRPLRQGLLPPLHPDVRQRGARHRQGRASSTSCSAVKKKQKVKADVDLDGEATSTR